MTRRGPVAAGLLAFTLAVSPPAGTAAQAPDATPPGRTPSDAPDALDALDAQLEDAYEAAYNLDYEAAIAIAHRAVASAPAASRAHRAVASITWLEVLLRRGTVTVDHYMGGITRASRKMPDPPADLDATFRAELDRALALADAAVEARPDDPQALFDAGSAYALKASYTASIEGSMGAAFRTARRAFDLQESVLEHDPSRTDAGVVVGTYRYLVAGLRLPTRLFAYLAGFGGDKEKAIALLQAAADNPASRVEAGTALLLIYSREGRHDDALAIARQLAARYPRNRLFTLEAGAAAVRAGHAEEAETILTAGLARFESDPRRKVPGERALWHYKRGLARLSLNHPADARRDLEVALGSPSPGWIEGRIRTALGKLDDLAGHRSDALSQYHQARILCRQGDDGAGAAEAERWIRRPFSFEAVRRSAPRQAPWDMLPLRPASGP
ncbi:MAG: tetratricopeptide repeat protein [Vicinamibacterales bacterium]